MNRCVGVILALAMVASYAKKNHEPMVAFICGKGAMHTDPDLGWTSDRNTDCVENKEAILDYCKKAYPLLDVTNIVETSEFQHVKGWCPIGNKEACKSPEAFKVRPYRCLTGPFQSDALIVPKKCVFDHVHNEGQCHDYDWWKDVAEKSCRGLHNNMKTENFGMLLPCGVDLFTGVEFVCCPEDGAVVDSAGSSVRLDAPKIEVKVSVPEDKEQNDDVIEKYMVMGQDGYADNEHDVFTLAKKQLLKKNHDKIIKLMKQWEDARNRVNELKETDPKGAEKMNQEISSRFQEEYFALQTTGEGKMLQLDAAHQEHVQTNLNTKKNKAIASYMDELQSDLYDPEMIMKYLQRYINMEQKDAKHCVHHYMKIRDRDPQAANSMKSTTVEHLQLIKSRIEQAIGMLSQIDKPKVREIIEKKLRDWMSSEFASLDSTIRAFTEKQQVKEVPQKVVEKIPEKKSEKLPVVSEKGKPELMKPDLELDIVKEKPFAPKSIKYKEYADKLSEGDFVRKPEQYHFVQQAAIISKQDKINVEFAKGVVVNHMAKSNMAAEANSIVQNGTGTAAMSAGSAIAVAIGVVGAIAIIVFSVMIVKKRQNVPAAITYVEVAVEDNLSAEDRHIMSMQSGYENPTYRLLEQRRV